MCGLINSTQETQANTYSAHSIDDGGGAFWLLGIGDSGLLAHQRPEFVQVDGWAVSRVPLQVVVSHTHLTKVPWMAEKRKEGRLNGQIITFRFPAFSKRPNLEAGSCWKECVGDRTDLNFEACSTPEDLWEDASQQQLRDDAHALQMTEITLTVSQTYYSMQHLLFIKVDPVVVHATGITATSRMLSVFACQDEAQFHYMWRIHHFRSDHGKDEPEPTNATVSVADVPSELPGLGLLGGLSKMRLTQISDHPQFIHIPWG